VRPKHEPGQMERIPPSRPNSAAFPRPLKIESVCQK